MYLLNMYNSYLCILNLLNFRIQLLEVMDFVEQNQYHLLNL